MKKLSLIKKMFTLIIIARSKERGLYAQLVQQPQMMPVWSLVSSSGAGWHCD